MRERRWLDMPMRSLQHLPPIALPHAPDETLNARDARAA